LSGSQFKGKKRRTGSMTININIRKKPFVEIETLCDDDNSVVMLEKKHKSLRKKL